ncbi:MAG: DNRLRE domain-containing protein [Sedimentisphaerales bacterium]|nr:DNRLRE domain-containing protein [Sedimentisphaerales bacterium]
MKKLYLLFVIAILTSVVFGESVSFTANVSCRTEGGSYVDTNRTDSSKLSVRRTSNGNKSWIKFTGLESVDTARLKTAVLTIALQENKTGAQSCDVSYVNDDCLDNITWAENTITWNNAPGNDPGSLAALDTTKTTYLSTVNFTNGVAGQTFDIDVLAVLQTDTDGIVQFVLHNSPNLLNFATHDNSVTARRPVLNIVYYPIGADEPSPAVGAVVETSLQALSWTLPEPNAPGTPIYCDVYLGTLLPGQTEPNRPQMDKATLGNNVNTVAINTTNFPAFGALADKTTYYWFVDCHDSSKVPSLIPGEPWSFSTYNNEVPVVEAGANQTLWGLPLEVSLDGTVTDDGMPVPHTLTYAWTQVSGPVSAVINSPAAEDTTVTITERGDYQFMLTASDGEKESSDSLRIVVGDTSCDASHIETGAAYNIGDYNRDCIVDLIDMVELIAADWLNCTDTLVFCGN